MITTNRFTFLALLTLLVATTGCRTYGGHGNEAATIEQVQRANQEFANALDRARTDLKRLQQAAQSNPALDSFVPIYEDAIARHAEQLASHRAYADRLQDDSSYRTVSRIFGAIIAEQRTINIRYSDIHARIQRTVQGQPRLAERPSPESRSYVVPTFYTRIENEGRLSMSQALQGAN